MKKLILLLLSIFILFSCSILKESLRQETKEEKRYWDKALDRGDCRRMEVRIERYSDNYILIERRCK